MSKISIRPPVPELARAKGETVEELALYFIQYHNRPKVRWSYRPGTRIIMSAYKGLHDINTLISGINSEKIEQSRTCNRSLIEYAAPFAFGRNTQVFQLPAKRFQFGRDRSSAFRIPFFFVEDGIIKLLYVQPRKTDCPSPDELAFTATIHKNFLLDTEFYGERADVEYIDIGPETKGFRSPIRYSLSDLKLWSSDRLEQRLTLLSSALEKAEDSGLLKLARRPSPPTADMPLFD